MAITFAQCLLHVHDHGSPQLETADCFKCAQALSSDAMTGAENNSMIERAVIQSAPQSAFFSPVFFNSSAFSARAPPKVAHC